MPVCCLPGLLWYSSELASCSVCLPVSRFLLSHPMLSTAVCSLLSSCPCSLLMCPLCPACLIFLKQFHSATPQLRNETDFPLSLTGLCPYVPAYLVHLSVFIYSIKYLAFYTEGSCIIKRRCGLPHGILYSLTEEPKRIIFLLSILCS